MPGLVPGIHVLLAAGKTWMAGTSPAMTTESPKSLQLEGNYFHGFRVPSSAACLRKNASTSACTE